MEPALVSYRDVWLPQGGLLGPAVIMCVLTYQAGGRRRKGGSSTCSLGGPMGWEGVSEGGPVIGTYMQFLA